MALHGENNTKQLLQPSFSFTSRICQVDPRVREREYQRGVLAALEQASIRGGARQIEKNTRGVLAGCQQAAESDTSSLPATAPYSAYQRRRSGNCGKYTSTAGSRLPLYS